MKNDIIEAKTLDLEDFIKILGSKDYEKLYPNNCFPTDEMMNEFLSSITDYKDKDIKNILRRFLIKSCTFGLDEFYGERMLEEMKQTKKIPDYSNHSEYQRRLLTKMLTGEGNAWEGLTWVLDLLPVAPNEAIKVINAFFVSNCLLLPDTWVNSLSDCQTIIRARYINYIHPTQVFHDLEPKEFELLVAKLYTEMGYQTNLTQSSYDGGIDIEATNNSISKKEKLIIQCKRYTKKTIGVSDVRALLGVLHSVKATKGALITSSKFSDQAKKLEKDNRSLELIDGKDLVKLLNTYMGTYWVDKLDKILRF